MTLTPSIALSVLYVGSLFSVMLGDDGNQDQRASLGTFEGIVELFQDPSIIFPAWVHYLVFDALVARMILLDSIQRKFRWSSHLLFVVPCMVATCLVGPTGFLAYMMLRSFILPSSDDEQTGKSKIL